MNFHEPLEIKSNFQRPSSSESPLTAIFGTILKHEISLLKLITLSTYETSDVRLLCQLFRERAARTAFSSAF